MTSQAQPFLEDEWLQSKWCMVYIRTYARKLTQIQRQQLVLLLLRMIPAVNSLKCRVKCQQYMINVLGLLWKAEPMPLESYSEGASILWQLTTSGQELNNLINEGRKVAQEQKPDMRPRHERVSWSRLREMPRFAVCARRRRRATLCVKSKSHCWGNLPLHTCPAYQHKPSMKWLGSFYSGKVVRNHVEPIILRIWNARATSSGTLASHVQTPQLFLLPE